jgi:hypothetical protein
MSNENVDAQFEWHSIAAGIDCTRQSSIKRKVCSTDLGVDPMPTTPKMIVLRCQAENLHTQWLAKNYELVRSELNRVPRKHLAIVCGLMTDLNQPLRRLEFWNWLEDSLANDTKIVSER